MSHPGPPSAEAPRQGLLLVYLFQGLGDAVLLVPLVQAVQRSRPDLDIAVLVRPLAARLWRQVVDLDVTVHEFPDVLVEREYDNIDEPVGPPKDRDPRDVARARERLAAQVRARPAALAADLTCKLGIDSREWLAACGARQRAGWLRPAEDGRAEGLTDGVPDVRDRRDRHWVDYCLLPLAPLGVRPEPDAEAPRAALAVAPAPPRERPHVVLVPGASAASKRWPLEGFAAVGTHLADTRGADLTVVGAPGEHALVSRVVRGIGQGAAAYTEPDLAGLVSLIGGADAVVTNDTGPMHLAFALEVPTVALFSRMSPVVWGPRWRGERHAIVTPDRSGRIDPHHVRGAAVEALDRGRAARA